MGGTPLGAPIIGWVAGVVGPRWGLIGGGLVCLLAALAIALLLGLPARSARGVADAARPPSLARADDRLPSGRRRVTAAIPPGSVGVPIERGRRPRRPAAGRLPRPDRRRRAARPARRGDRRGRQRGGAAGAARAYPMRAVIGVRDAARGAARRRSPAWTSRPTLVDKWVLSEVVGFRVTRGVLASADRARRRRAWPSCWPARGGVAVLEAAQRLREPRARCSATPPRSASTRCCSTRNAPTRSTAAACGCRWATCCGCRSRCCRRAVARVARRASGTPDSRLLALTPAADAIELRSVVPPTRWARVAGAEGPGLSAAALAAADRRVRIPMAPGVDSLNVATAAAVAFAHLS